MTDTATVLPDPPKVSGGDEPTGHHPDRLGRQDDAPRGAPHGVVGDDRAQGGEGGREAGVDERETMRHHRTAAHLAELGGDNRLAVGGDSAGGNLAAVTALHAGEVKPVFLLLFYPAVDASVRRRSRELFGNGFFLTDEKMDWFLDHYAPSREAHTDPRLSVLLAEDLSGMPPTYVATAGFDPHARRDFHDLVHRLSDLEGMTILLTTHDLAEAEKLADRILVLAGGRIIADGSPDQLSRRVEGKSEVRWTHDGLRHVHTTDDATAFVRDLFRQHTSGISELEVRRSTLEDTYMALVQRHESGQATEEEVALR